MSPWLTSVSSVVNCLEKVPSGLRQPSSSKCQVTPEAWVVTVFGERVNLSSHGLPETCIDGSHGGSLLVSRNCNSKDSGPRISNTAGSPTGACTLTSVCIAISDGESPRIGAL